MIRRLPLLLLLVLALGAGAGACGSSTLSEDTVGQGEAGEAEATPTPAAKVDSLTGRTTTVALDPGFLDALERLQVTPEPTGTGRLDGTDLEFPITGGHVEYYGPDSGVEPYVQGRIEHSTSGLKLTGGGKVVDLEHFTVNPGTSTLTGKVVVGGEVAEGDTTPLFFLDGRTLENPPEIDEAAGTVTLTGTTVKLKQEAAQLLNQTFGVDDFEGGLVIGTATIVANLDPEFD